MHAEIRKQVKVKFDNKINSITIRENKIFMGQGDNEFTMEFDTKESFQFFLNMLLMALNQRVKKANEESEYGRTAYVYDYEPLSNPDLVQNLWESVENASDPILTD